METERERDPGTWTRLGKIASRRSLLGLTWKFFKSEATQKSIEGWGQSATREGKVLLQRRGKNINKAEGIKYNQANLFFTTIEKKTMQLRLIYRFLINIFLQYIWDKTIYHSIHDFVWPHNKKVSSNEGDGLAELLILQLFAMDFWGNFC